MTRDIMIERIGEAVELLEAVLKHDEENKSHEDRAVANLLAGAVRLARSSWDMVLKPQQPFIPSRELGSLMRANPFFEKECAQAYMNRLLLIYLSR